MVDKWNIYLCNLNPTSGSEQRGKRPVLVVSNDAVNHNLTVSTVLPLSSIKSGDRIYPTEVFINRSISGLPKDSVVMVQQVRTISHQRLENQIGRINDTITQEQIKEVIRQYFEV